MVSPRLVLQTTRRKTCCSRPGLLVPSVGTRFRNSNRDSFPLTIQPAPVRVVMGWACANILIQTQWYRTRNGRWQRARSTVGTGGIFTTSKCLARFQNTMVSALRRHLRSFQTSTRRSYSAAVATKKLSFVTSTIEETNIPEAMRSKGSFPTWNAAIVKLIHRWSRKALPSFLVPKAAPNARARG